MSLRLYADTVQEALDRADARHWTRQPPRSDRARTKYLLQQVKGDHDALATRLGTDSDTVFRILAGDPPTDDALRDAIERETLRLWQPHVRWRAHAAIMENDGQMTVSFRAWFGFTAAAGTTDDPRLRFLTLSLPSPHLKRLFRARHRNAPEAELHQLLSEALAASYFHRDGIPSALETVTLKRIDYLEFSY
ncbi:telomere-protecting terminal protein Tpg [Streptomyces pini]|uniref:Uncharacterized protein n=1 Tax=Streptomyces pini TaxID=1520580 RepID=A0A1I4JM46_9ACTN|nr:XRE family transcriptional regulator [Streptomyces pini]SFL67678.1 hypothetical protein SAMN05192584_12418 [Streptomyces pini]